MASVASVIIRELQEKENQPVCSHTWLDVADNREWVRECPNRKHWYASDCTYIQTLLGTVGAKVISGVAYS